MIELHQFRPFWGLPNASPFSMKAETYLRFRGIPYQVVPSGPRKSPTGKIPFIVEDGRSITDSEAIIDHFERREPVHLDAGLREGQNGKTRLFALQADNARRAIYPERDSPADLAAASMRRNTLAGKVMLTRSALSDRDAKSTATTAQI